MTEPDPAACRALLWVATLGLITEQGFGVGAFGEYTERAGPRANEPSPGQQPPQKAPT